MNSWVNVHDNPTYKVDEYGNVMNTSTGKMLKPIKCATGYTKVVLCDNGCHKSEYIHRLVASAFIPNPHDLPIINHIDGCKDNNNVGNLEWSSYSNNTKHAYKIGLQKPIPEQIESSLSKAREKLKKPVRNIETGTCYESVIECSEKEGVSRPLVTSHITGRVKKCRYEYV